MTLPNSNFSKDYDDYDDDGYEDVEYPRVFICKCCNVRHTAFALIDEEIEILMGILADRRETLRSMLEEEGDRKERKMLKFHLDATDQIADRINVTETVKSTDR
jgi:hypothetical protein